MRASTPLRPWGSRSNSPACVTAATLPPCRSAALRNSVSVCSNVRVVCICSIGLTSLACPFWNSIFHANVPQSPNAAKRKPSSRSSVWARNRRPLRALRALRESYSCVRGIYWGSFPAIHREKQYLAEAAEIAKNNTAHGLHLSPNVPRSAERQPGSRGCVRHGIVGLCELCVFARIFFLQSGESAGGSFPIIH